MDYMIFTILTNLVELQERVRPEIVGNNTHLLMVHTDVNVIKTNFKYTSANEYGTN
jgi:hypothetical protein